MTATFVQPNYASQNQSGTQYPTNIDAATQVMAKTSTMFAAHQTSAPSMYVTVDGGAILKADQTLPTVSPQTLGPFAATVSSSRIDRIVLDQSTGLASIVSGVESATPVAPLIPFGKLPCAQILFTVGMTAIGNGSITDERTLIVDPIGRFNTISVLNMFLRSTKSGFSVGVAWNGKTPDGINYTYAVAMKGNVYASYDAITWVTVLTPSSAVIYGITYNKAQSLWVAGGNDTSTRAIVYTSPNGITWTMHIVSTVVGSSMYCITYDSTLSLLCGVGQTTGTGGQGTYSYASTDGVTWTTGTYIDSANLNTICSLNGKFFAVGEGIAYTSINGLNWTSSPISNTINYGAVYAINGIVVAAGSVYLGSGLGGASYSLDNGVSWHVATSTLNGNGGAVYYNDIWVLTTNGGLYTSPDGITWTYRSYLQNNENISAIMYAYNNWIAGGSNGGIYSSLLIY